MFLRLSWKTESVDENEHSSVHSAHKCILKKIENHAAAVALWFVYYNFCRVHTTLRVTPAMAASISNHVWTIDELCGLLPEMASATKRTDKGLILKALGEQAS